MLFYPKIVLYDMKFIKKDALIHIKIIYYFMSDFMYLLEL